MIRSGLIAVLAATAVVVNAGDAWAARFKGQKPAVATEVIFSQASDAVDASVETSDDDRFNIRTSGRNYRLGFLNERDGQTAYVPVVAAVRNSGGRVQTFAKALQSGDCSGMTGLTALKTSAKNIQLEAVTNDEGIVSYAYLKKAKGTRKGANARKRNKLTKIVSKSVGLVELGSDCSPIGNATNYGNTGVSTSSLTILATTDGDADADGLPDLFDTDVDADGVVNAYDADYEAPERSFYVFSNLKASLQQVVNSNTGVQPTRAAVDSLLQSVSILAIEVVAESADGESAELDCGALEYCKSAGTGEVAQTVTAFPDDVDSDGDGKGTITRGSTGDFQLETNATLTSINAGDTFVQEVADSSGNVTSYFATLGFAFKATPALKSITDVASASTTTFSYPVSDGAVGTTTNCLPVTLNGDGDVVLEITAWRPQKRGSAPLGSTGDFIDIGGSEITIDIPNVPGTGPGTAVRSPNNCGASNYSESDANLSVSGDMLIDGASDAIANSANTVTFSVNITDCLAESSDTLDSGEQVDVDLQFRSLDMGGGSDNAAVKFCIRRA